MASQGSSPPIFTVKDFQDPTLTKFNKSLAFLYGKIGQIYGQGNVSLNSSILIPSLALTTGSTVPTDLSSVLTLGAAEALFEPIGPRTVSGSGTPGTPGPPGPPGPPGSSVTLEAADYCMGGGLTQACINNAIAALPSTGGAIHVKTGTWSFTNSVNCNLANVLIFGDGPGTLISRTASMPSNKGMFDVTVTGITLQSMQINGNVTTPVKLEYNTAPPNGFEVASPEDATLVNYPLASTLTPNTSVWVHGGSNSFTAYGLLITQSGGYGILFDASVTSLYNMYVAYCNFLANVPNTFGTNPADLNYGAWTGNIAYIGGTYQGGTGSLSAVIGLTVDNCNFTSIAGTGVFGYSPQTTVLHQNIVVSNCHFKDFGLDGINTAVAQNVTVGDNTFYRGGYIGGNPKWANTTPSPVAIDTSGFVRSFKYVGNTIFNMNGEGIDLDGATDGTVSGNNISVASPTDYYYTLDQVGSYYAGGKGIQTGNTYDIRGAQSVSITGNTIRNMSYNGIVSFNQRNGIISGNTIYHPASAGSTPIIVQNNVFTGTVDTSGTSVTRIGGTSFSTTWPDDGYIYIVINSVQYKIASISGVSNLTLETTAGTQTGVTYTVGKSQNNTITANTIYYDAPAICILEDSTYGNVYGPNHVFNNRCLGYNSGEFNFIQPGPTYSAPAGNSSTSSLILGTVTGVPPASGIVPYVQQSIIQREGSTVTNNAVTKIYSNVYSSATNTVVGAQIWSVTDATESTLTPGLYSPLMNVALGGAAGTGVISTANRVSYSFPDVMATGKLFADAFLMLTDSTFQYTNDPNADSLPTSYGLMRYNSSVPQFEVSQSASGGHRTWTALSVGAGGNPHGNPGDVQYYVNSTTFGGSDNLNWNNTAQQLTVTATGLSSYAAIVLSDTNKLAYIESNGAVLADSTSYQALHAGSGGVWGLSMYSEYYISVGQSNGVPGSGGGAAPVTSGDAVPNLGNVYFDTGLGQFRGYNGSWINLGGGSGAPSGPINAVQLQSNPTGSFVGYLNFVYDDSVQTLTVKSTRATAYSAILLADSSGLAIFESQGAILADSTSTAALHAPNGGVTAIQGIFSYSGAGVAVSAANGTISGKDLTATDTVFNSIQTVQANTSGVYAASFTAGVSSLSGGSNGAIYFKATGSAPNNPSGGYGGLYYVSGSTFGYYNGGWQTVNFATIAGVTSITGSANEILVSSPTGAVTLSTPQGIATTSSPVFANVTGTGTVQSQASGATIGFQLTNSNFTVLGNGEVTSVGLFQSTGITGGFGVTDNTSPLVNSIQTTGGVNVSSGGSSAGVYQVHNQTVINASGTWIGNGVNMPSYGCNAGGGYAVGSNNGQTYLFHFSTPFTVNGSGSFTNIQTHGGIITSVS